MRAVYKVTVSPTAPALHVEGPFAKAFSRITGQEDIASLSPDASFRGALSRLAPWTQFYGVCPGALALSETAWERCMDMYYEITGNNIELIAVETSDTDMRVIVPREVNPPAKDPGCPCDLKYASSLFRIADRDLAELYCQQAFVDCYKQFHFEGLHFALEWQSNN